MVDEKEVYASIIQKYKTVINNPNSSDLVVQTHRYTFYKLINDGTTLEKNDDFSFDAEVNPKEYKRLYPIDKVEKIPVD